MRAVVVIPTYNEAGSIGEMLDYLNTRTFPDIKAKKGNLTWEWDMQVLVVDDSSPDGTGQIVKTKSEKYPSVHLLERTAKTGIGSAYLDGFKYSMEKLHADYVFEMDGDFQHPPETIILALRALEEGNDYVIGSRKITGGSNPKGWGFKRLFLSEVGSLVGRFIMFFPFKNFFKVTDPTTGFKVTKVKGYLDKLNLEKSHLYSRSFGYKFQLLYETLALGVKFKEVPLVFKVRNAGESKIETQTAKEVFIVAVKLRWFDPVMQKFIKFGIIGGIGFVVNVVGARIFKSLLITPQSNISLLNGVCNALAAEISIISNFTWNNLWTFAADKITSIKELLSKFVAFNLSSVITGILIPSFVIFILTNIFGDHLFIFQIIAILFLTIPLNWFVYNKFIWKKKS